MAKRDGILAVWTDAAREGEADFNEWYNRQHLIERVSVPGFRTGARYKALAGSPRYFAFYETRAPAVLRSKAYRARLDRPTAWTRRSMKAFRNSIRSACRVAGRIEPVETMGGRAGVCATLRFAPRPGSEASLEGWIVRTLLARLQKSPGLTGAQLWITDAARSANDSREAGLRAPDALADWVLFAEGQDAGALHAALRRHASADRLQRQGAMKGERLGLYRLLLTVWR